jgi:hypothetical protein
MKKVLSLLLTLSISFYSNVSLANTQLLISTLYEQGNKFIELESLDGNSASAFSIYRMMAKTDANHPMTKAFAGELNQATQQKVNSLYQSGNANEANKLKLRLLSLHYEAGTDAPAWASISGAATTTPSVPKPTQNFATAPIPASTLTIPQGKQLLTSKERRTLRSLAKKYMKSKAFFAPGTRNAFDKVRKLVQDDPKNESALDLYFDLIQAAEKEITSLLEDGESDQALSLVEQGLAVMPNSGTLNKLQQLALGQKNFSIYIDQLHNPNEYSPELNSRARKSLYESGRSLLSSKVFFKPEGNNAFDKFASILSREPSYERARNQMFNLSTNVYREVEKMVSEANFNLAVNLLEQGLDIVPNHSGWQFAKEELELKAKLDQQRLSFAQQNYSTTLSSKSRRNLLSNFKVYMKNKQFFGSTKSNANAALLMIQASYPDEDRLARYLLDINDDVYKEAIDLVKDGKLQTAQALLQEAEQYLAALPKLARLKRDIDSLVAIID